MAAMLDRGQAALIRRQKQAGGRTVTYTRLSGSPAPVPITAWIGETRASRLQEDPGIATIWGDRDYFIAVEDMLAAGLNTPQQGDRITEVIAGVAVKFELMPPDDGQPPWRFSDQFRTVFRMHTKRVS